MDAGNGYSSEKVRVPKLTGPNYRLWSKQMKRSLQGMKHWQAIEPNPRPSSAQPTGSKTAEESQADSKGKGSEPIVIYDDDETPEAKARIRDYKASSYIMDRCSQDVLLYIIDLDTAKEQWETLERRYAPMDT